MLARLSIRDIVLIERLDIEFSRGLAVLTGETGAGKSILLDAFALALGGRGDASLVRHGVEQGQVTAVFDVPKTHPASKILSDNGLDDNGEMILRRVQLADGRTRAFINDQAISVQTLKAVGTALVEIHGQHDERALVDAATHRRLLDAFAGLEKDVAALETHWDARRDAHTALDAHRAGMERAERKADYLRHAADELKKLKAKDGEETTLAERRTSMMQGEKIAGDLREAQDAVSGNHSPVAALSAAVRRLERRAGNAPALVEPAVKAIDAAINALEEADQHLSAAGSKLSAARAKSAEKLNKAVNAELAPLKLERAKFSTQVESDPNSPGPQGFDRVEFWVQTNPGTKPGPLMKVASGGELSRFLLALKVVLSDRGSAPTLVFDEIDTGVGGAVADAIGARLARLAGKVQVMAVTHAPQVAARADQHLLISKDALDRGKRVATRVNALAADHRREEIARMLAGAEITAEARAAAERLLRAATA
jgi:DNA repair protein RecN (Recombination protein N)